MEPYRIERLVCFIEPNHPFARLPIRQFQAATIPVIIRAGTPVHTRTESAFAAIKNNPCKLVITMRCGSTSAVKEAVALGAGIGILDEDTIRPEIERGDFLPIKIPGLKMQRPSYIVYPKDNEISAITREFIALLREAKKEVSAIPALVKPQMQRHAPVPHGQSNRNPPI